jgi:hypothetical protein
MPLSLICDCGARFEVEDALAGQSVSCPECQQPLKAPAVRRPVVRTSNLALASFILAIVGAFTVVGTVAAVVVGLMAVVAILRDRERLAGLGFAVCGIILGLALSTLTIFALTTGEMFGFGGALRRTQLADQQDDKVDPKKAVEIAENGFSITKPVGWYRAKPGFQYPPLDPLLRKDSKLLLDQPDLNAYLDVQIDSEHPADIDAYITARMTPAPINPNAGPKDKPGGSGKPPAGQEQNQPEERPAVGDPQKIESRDLLGDDGVRVHELTVEQKVEGRGWKVLIRTYQTSNRLFIVRAFTETAGFARVKDELEKVLDGFKVSPAP